jgi:cytochrome c
MASVWHRRAVAAAFVIASLLLLTGASDPAPTAADSARGQEFFNSACVSCHSLTPNKNLTGPSLHALWGRKAGSLPSFQRYSPALKSADVQWNDQTLDQWLTDPKSFIPGNVMIFSGIQGDDQRADLIAFLKEATDPARQNAQTMPQGMMSMEGSVPNLKSVSPESQVKEIKYCGDTYTVLTADGKSTMFWERNLRFKTDMSVEGPSKGSPAMVGAGMVGDRASIIFAAPEEFGQFIKRQC